MRLLKCSQFSRFDVCDFSKNYQKSNISKFCQILEFPTLYLRAVKILSGIANLTSNYDCSNLCSLRDMTCVQILKKSQKILVEIPDPLVGSCQKTF